MEKHTCDERPRRRGRRSVVEQGTLRIPAKIEKRDSKNDLAILTVGAEIAATPLLFSQTKAVTGQAVFAIGNPEGLENSKWIGNKYVIA